ncbi:MAG: alpha-L-rhamnosidase, partial [Balneolaceae bacterium]
MKKYNITALIGFFFLITAFGISEAQTLSVDNLQTEYRINPVGIDVEQPRFSWIIQSDERNTMQTAYRLQVAKALPDFNASDVLIHDTGRVQTEQSVHNVYSGPELQPGVRYFWRMKVWDNHGNESDWSDTAFWETGLLNANNWAADWIEPDIEVDVETSPPAPMIRREFQLNGDIAHARAYVTSHGVYEMEINGERVGDQILTPGWTSYHNRLQYQTYDVTDMLSSGENAVGVMLGDGWFRGFIGWGDQRNYYGEKLALLMQLEITYSDGRTETITSDENWKASTGPVMYSDLYNGEFYDARREIAGWSLAGFNDRDWSGVRLVDHGKEQLIGQQVQPVKKIQELKPIDIFETPEGDIVLDMGQNMIGWIRLKVEGEEGTIVTLRHAETLDREGNFYTDNLRSADQENTYILKGGGIEVWEPRFTFQGFRYVAVDGYPGELTPDAITGVVLHSDMEMTGHFQSSNELVNQLQHNIVWGQKGNFLDIPTDCPQRDERMGWTGDIQVFAETANLNMNTNAFLTKWLADLEADQNEEGSIPFVVPDVLGGFGSAGWADAGVIVPWTLYQSYGDTRILETQYESMKAWVDYMDNRAAETEKRYLWDNDFTFGDWLSFSSDSPAYPGAYTDQNMISTAFYAWSSKLMSETAGVLGREDDQRHYAALYENIREVFQQEYVTPAGRVMSDTQTAYLLALRIGLLPDEMVDDAVGYLIRRVRAHGHLTTGFLGTPHLNPILSEYGHRDLAFELLMRQDYPSWLYPVTMGATTIWERWDGIRPDGTFQSESMNSLNHYAYGAIGEWLFKEVAGIEALEPGYKKIQIKPVPGGGLDHARGFLISPYGKIESSWEIDDEGFRIMVEIPTNTAANITLPHARLEDVTESGRKVQDSEYFEVIESGNNVVTIRAGSGRYTFSYPSEKLVSDLQEYHDEEESIDEPGDEIDSDTRLAQLLAEKSTRAILEQHLTELMNSAWLSQVMGFSLDTAMQTL